MGSIERTERIVKDMSFAAGAEMDEHLWQNVAEQRQQAHTKTQRRGEARAWRILMNSKIAKLTVAAVVVVAALAVGVERLTRTKSEGASAFSAEIKANMALDLDPRAAIPLRQTQPEDFDVIWDGENGGTLRIMPGSSLRLLAPGSIDPEWDNVVAWAHRVLEKIGESTTTSIAARETQFAAILTSEGNLAVVRIGEYDESKAQLRWQVESTEMPGYGPERVVTLACLDPNTPTAQPCAVDFDTGQTTAVPADVLSLAPEDFLAWLEENGIDAIARMTEDDAGLSGVGLAHRGIAPGVWAVVPAVAARDLVGSMSYQSRDPILFQDGLYQTVYAFRTREGAVGLLKMGGADRAQRTVEFQYKMVEQDPALARLTAAEDESHPLHVSARWLCDLGKYVLLYAGEHEDRLPQSLEELRDYAQSEEEYQWMVNDVEYLGAGLTCADPISLVIAYDRTLLAAGKGTNVLFLDSRIEYVEPERFPTLILPGNSEADEPLPIHASARWLSDLGKYVLLYAGEHEDQLPQSLEELRGYAQSEEEYQWMIDDVEYLGAGLTCDDPFSLVIAYDQTLLAAGQGTNVLFLDSHIEYVDLERFAELSLPEDPEDASAASGQ
ncbi:MAG: hypothetical protein JSW27_04700 [Phycisphaerales bacterium]|nr:MAG: hypothetical protein JSW27_04700 [Phycisphaerales bacterium]